MFETVWRFFGGRALGPRRAATRERPAEVAGAAEPTDFAGWVRRFGLDDAGLRTPYKCRFFRKE